MNKKLIIGIVILSIVILGIFVIVSKNSDTQCEGETCSQGTQAKENKELPIQKPAEKIEVVHFHATQQCWSCKTVGEYSLKTIKEKFPEEYKNGTIVFRDINVELPENKDIVTKYQARGSSLFINGIIEGKDNIGEDTAVWRLISNEGQFVYYFENKLKTLLGK